MPAPFITILYAEDDANDVFFMQRAFQERRGDRQLKVVTNGNEAVAYLCGQGRFSNRSEFPFPDLVLLDIKMPEMSGLEVLAWVRREHALAALPVVLFTSSTLDADIEKARAHGADGFLVKPSNVSNLTAVTEDLFRLATAKDKESVKRTISNNRI